MIGRRRQDLAKITENPDATSYSPGPVGATCAGLESVVTAVDAGQAIFSEVPSRWMSRKAFIAASKFRVSGAVILDWAEK